MKKKEKKRKKKNKEDTISIQREKTGCLEMAKIP